MHEIDRTTDSSIFPNVAFITAPMSNLYAIPYNATARKIHIIRFHFIEDQ